MTTLKLDMTCNMWGRDSTTEVENDGKGKAGADWR